MWNLRLPTRQQVIAFVIQQRLEISWAIAFVVISVFIGHLTGWLVGVSQSPVVSAIIPGILAIGGAFSFFLSDRHTSVQKVSSEILKIDEINSAPEAVKKRIANLMGTSHLPWWLPILWTIAIGLFCWSMYSGIEAGVKKRVGNYPSLETLIKGVATSPEERSILTLARMNLISARVEPTEVEAFFSTVLIPTINSRAEVTAIALSFGEPVSYFGNPVSENLARYKSVVEKNVAADQLDNEISRDTLRDILNDVLNGTLHDFQSNISSPDDAPIETSIETFPLVSENFIDQLLEDSRTARQWLKTLQGRMTILTESSKEVVSLANKQKLATLRRLSFIGSKGLEDIQLERVIPNTFTPDE